MFTSLLKRVKNLRQKQPDVGLGYGLSDNEVAALRSLRNDDGYDVFLKALDAYARLQTDGLLRPSARNATVHYQRGHIAGLLKAGTLVDEVVRAYDDRDAARAEAERRKRGRSAGRGAALYATPFGGPKP